MERLILLKGEAASKISLAFHLESNNLESSWVLQCVMHTRLACNWDDQNMDEATNVIVSWILSAQL